MNSKFDLDTPLITFSGESEVAGITIRQAVTGCCIFGSNGSGKTSSSSKLIALRYLRAGFGGLVLTCKTEEKQQWVEWCRQTGREQDLIIVEPGGKHKFNFLEYESQDTSGASYTDNVYEVLNTVITAGQEKASGERQDAFWSASLQLLLINIIDLTLLAYSKVTVQTMYDIAQSAPKNSDFGNNKVPEGKETSYTIAVKKAKENVMAQVQAWRNTKNNAWLDALSADDAETILAEEIPDYRKLKVLHQYFIQTLINIGEKTRAILDLTVINFLAMLLRDPIYSLLCKGTSTFSPEDCIEKGKIVLINLPTKLFRKIGVDTQILIKYIFQRAWEKRDITKNDRPLFLFADESHTFLHPHDSDFQATVRSSRVCVVYISQSLSNYFTSLNGSNSEHRVKSLLSTMGVKIFHANSHVETNEFASSLMGEAYFEDASRTVGYSKEFNASNTVSYKLEKIVRPETFFTLKTGGPINSNQCEAYVVMQGVKFSNGFHFKKITFNQ